MSGTLPWALKDQVTQVSIWVKPPTYETDGHIVVHASVAGIDGEGAVLPVNVISTPSQATCMDRIG
jgi:hypothetical protein